MSSLLFSAAFALAAYAIFLFGVNEGQGLFYGKHVGEALVIEALERSAPRPFHLLNNVTLRSTHFSNATTQIDHIVVTLKGIFVIETKHYSGRIFGNPTAPEWLQVFCHKKVWIRNPVYQNCGHVEELARLLDLGPGAFFNLVVFSGRTELQGRLGTNVISLSDLPRYFEVPRPVVLSERALCSVVGRIEMNRLPRSNETDEYHVHAIKQRLRNGA